MADVVDRVQGWADALARFDLWDAVRVFYRENEGELVDMNRQQLALCLTSDGRTILGLSMNPVSLYRTGAFNAGIFIHTDDEKIEFRSSDPKWANEVQPAQGWDITMTPLREWFGDTLLGIPDNMAPVVDTAMRDRVGEILKSCFD